MIRRNTWILVAIFAALLLLAWYLQKKPDTVSEAESTQSVEQEYVMDFSLDELVGLKIEGKSGRAEFEKTEEGLWKLVFPDTPVEATDSPRIDQAASLAATMRPSSTFPDSPPLTALGLDTPDHTLTFVLDDGAEIVLYVGDKTAVGTGYYVAVKGEAPVVVSLFNIDLFLDFISSPPIVDTPTPTLTETPEAEATGTPES